MNAVPVRFTEDVLLLVNYSLLQETKKLKTPWSTISRLNIRKRFTLQMHIHFSGGSTYILSEKLCPLGGGMSFDTIDFRFLTNFIVSCEKFCGLNCEDDPDWKRISLSQVEKLISKRSNKATELLHRQDTLFSRGLFLLTKMNESDDNFGIGKILFRSMPIISRQEFEGVHGYEKEFESFLLRMESIHEVDIRYCSGITPRIVDLLVDKFEAKELECTIRMPEIPMTQNQFHRLMEKVLVDDVPSCVCKVWIDSNPDTFDELYQIYDFPSRFPQIEEIDESEIYGRDDNLKRDLTVDIRRDGFDRCKAYSNCDFCVTDEKCGFCAEDSNNGKIGWCLPVSHDDSEQSTVGYCMNVTSDVKSVNGVNYGCADSYCLTKYTVDKTRRILEMSAISGYVLLAAGVNGLLVSCPSSKLAPGDRENITNVHNWLRSSNALGNQQDGPNGAYAPQGKNIYKLQYSCELEQMAQAWADRCEFKHSANDAGENIYAVFPKQNSNKPLINAAYSWWSELKNYGVGQYSPDYVLTQEVFNAGTGHYTQMVWADTTEIGCGVAQCDTPRSMTFVVCNYRSPGNWMGDYIYQIGSPCTADSQCTTYSPSSCSAAEGLCIKH